MKPSVSIVILTLNGGRVFHRCLEAVCSQKLERPFEIVVVDSGSTDGSDLLAETRAKVVRIAKKDFNHGLTRNLGVRETSGDLVAFLVQDAIPYDDLWLQRLVDALDDPSVAGAYSRQIPHVNSNPIVAARLKRWSAGGETPRVKSIPNPAAFEALKPIEKIDVVGFDNVASIIRRSDWEKTPFREAAFGEDTKWSMDVLRAGRKLVYEPRSVVRHSHSNSLWYEFKRVYLDHQNWNRLVGLKLFTEKREIFRAGFNGIFERMEDLRDASLMPPEWLYWMAWAIPYSFSQNLAQFLGAISDKWMKRWPWFAKFDALMRRGV